MDIQILQQRQLLPLEAKIMLSKNRIKEWYNNFYGEVYVSFSGGKDSTVLLHLVRSIYPEVKAVFIDTGLEYPEIKQFVNTINNVEIIRPKKNFVQVIKEYGYPVISKNVSRYVRDLQNPTENNKKTRRIRLGLEGGKVGILPKKWVKLVNAPFKCSEQCCDIMKKSPINLFEKKNKLKPFIGMMAEESRARKLRLSKGCNSFNQKKPQSNPLSFWTTKDIWDYLNKFKVPYCKIYDTGIKRTGCMFCMFGVHLEKEPNRFQQMEQTHPQIHNYCINKLGCGKVLDYIGVKSSLIKQEEVSSIPPNPKGIGYP